MLSGRKHTSGTFTNFGNRRGRRVLLTTVSAVAGLSGLMQRDAHAAVISLAASDGQSVSSFNAGTNWTGSVVPSPANDFFVGGKLTLRTTTASGNQTFLGNSLTLGGGAQASYGILTCKSNDVTGDIITVNNLNLSAGVIQNGGNSIGTPISWTLASNNINVLNGGFSVDNGGVATRLTTISGPLNGSGGLVANLNTTNSINSGILFLTGNNSLWTGAINVSGGTLEIGNGGSTGTLGTGTITGGTSGILAFNLSSGTTVPNTITGVVALANLLGSTTLSATNNTYTGATTVAAGSLTVSGSEVGSGAVTVGSVAGNTLLNVSGTLSATNFNLGTITGATSALYITGTGKVTATAAAAGTNFQIGDAVGAYGYVSVPTGTTLTANEIGIGGETAAGSGELDVTGGTVTDAGWVVLSRISTGNGQIGVLNINNGATLKYAGGGVVGNWGANQSSTVNVINGNLTATTAQPINLNQTNSATNSGFLNLIGGTAQANAVIGATGNTILTFQGGTLKAFSANTAFITVNKAYVYSGGGTIDNNGVAITIAQPLLAPSGSGATSISSFTTGAGYVAPPLVTVVPGTADTTGTGATAIATINPSTGQVTGVTITSPGSNYTVAPLFNLSGGGSTTAATVTGAAPTALTSGAMTFAGTGTTILTGSSTYTGGTTISAGTVQVGNGTTIGFLGTGAIVNNGTLAFSHSDAITAPGAITGTGGLKQLGTGNLTLTGLNTYSGPTTISAGNLIVASGGSISNTSSVSIASGSTLDVSVMPYLSLPTSASVLSGSGTLNGSFNQTVGTIAPATIGTAGTLAITNGNLSIAGGTLAVDLNGNQSLASDQITVGGNLSLTAPTILNASFLSSATVGEVFPIITFTGSFTGSANNLTVTSRTLSVSNTSNAINVTVTAGAPANLLWSSPSSSAWDVVTSTNWLNTDSGLTDYFYQGDNVSFNDSAGTLQTNINLTAALSPSAVTVNSVNNNYNFSGTGKITGLTGLTKLGSSTLTIGTGNDFTGTANVSGGTVLAVNTAGSATGAGPLLIGSNATVQIGNANAAGLITNSSITNSGTLTYNRTDATTIASNISGGGLLNVNGTGTLTLSGANTYTGNSNLTAGTLVVASSANLGTSTLVFNGGTFSPSGGNGVNISNGLLVTAAGGLVGAPTALTGPLTGTGTLTLQGGGGVIMAGDSSGFTGSIVGNLQVNFGIQGTGLVTNAATGVVTAIETSANVAYTTNFGNFSTNGFIFNNGGTYTANLGSLSGIAGSEIRASGGGTFGTVTLAVGGLNTNTTFNGEIINTTGGSNIVALTKVGTGTLTMTGLSFYTGPTIVNGGILSLAIQTNPTYGELYDGNTSGNTITVNNTGELLIAGTNALVGNSNTPTLVTINSGGLVTTSDTVTSHILNLNLSGGTLASGAPNSTYGSWAFTNTPTVNVTANSTISASNMSGNTNFVISPGVSLALSGNYGYASNLNVGGGGTLLVTGNNATDTGSLNIAAGSVVTVSNATTVGVLPTGAISDSGTLNFSANNVSGGFITTTVGALTVNSGATVNLARSSPRTTRIVLTTPSLSIAGTSGAWTGLVDLSNNDLDVQNGNLANITNQVTQAYASGNWNGTGGITSTAAAASATHLLTLGVIQNSVDQNGGSALMATFDGVTVANTDVLVKYTYYGDANLDGKVDGSDYSRIDFSYLSESTQANPFSVGISGWYNGDFNNDGVVDGSDYTLIDNAFNSQGTVISAQIGAVATAQLAGTSAVPEPTTLGLIGIGAVGLLGRRRRR